MLKYTEHLTQKLNALIIQVKSFLPEDSDKESVFRYVAKIVDVNGTMPKERYPKIALQLSGANERNLGPEESTYISPLYTISDNEGKIDDMLVVTLLENLKDLEEFELHLEI